MTRRFREKRGARAEARNVRDKWGEPEKNAECEQKAQRISREEMVSGKWRSGSI